CLSNGTMRSRSKSVHRAPRRIKIAMKRNRVIVILTSLALCTLPAAAQLGVHVGGAAQSTVSGVGQTANTTLGTTTDATVNGVGNNVGDTVGNTTDAAHNTVHKTKDKA